MKMNRVGLTCTGLAAVTLLIGSSGCATKGFVRTNIADTNAKISALESKTNQQFAATNDKEQGDVSRLQEEIATTNNKVGEVGNTAQQANTTATQANQLAEANKTAIAASTAAFDKALTYSVVAKGDVTFGFNKSNLGKTDQAALDSLVQQVQGKQRAVVELYGFTDTVGSKAYNLSLSQRRANSVARYMVNSGVPLAAIRILGMGEEPVPQSLLADLQTVDPNATAMDSSRLARRVLIRILVPNGNAISQSASLQ